MKSRLNRRSLFSQQLDRAAFAAYFLGAIVPLGALAWVVQRNELHGDGAFAWIGLLVSITVLSLGAFLALRRTTRASLDRMERDQQRLTGLLVACDELAQLPDSHSCAEALMHHASRLAKASGAFLAERGEDGEWSVRGATGVAEADALLDEPLCETLDRITGADGPDEEVAGGGLLCVGVRPDSSEPSALVVLPHAGDAFTEATREAVTTLGSLGEVALSNSDLRHAQRNFFAHVTELLTTALDGHGHRSAELANLVGHEMGLERERLQALHFAALLHDIGMLKLDRNLAYSPSAWKPHSRHGYEMLRQIRLWETSAPIVLSHHEHWDGTGYPDGLAGEAVPIEARILSVCDAFDSMTAQSSYREQMAFAQALDELETCSGTQFDPAVVAAFKKLVDGGVIEPAGVEVEEPALIG
jgi:hypothetical protein